MLDSWSTTDKVQFFSRTYTADFLGHYNYKCNQMNLALFEDGEEGPDNLVSTVVMSCKCRPRKSSWMSWCFVLDYYLHYIWALWQVNCLCLMRMGRLSPFLFYLFIIWSHPLPTNLPPLQLTNKKFGSSANSFLHSHTDVSYTCLSFCHTLFSNFLKFPLKFSLRKKKKSVLFR